MRNIVKLIGLFSLIIFSFFYTDKVLSVIKNEDEIMIELTSVEDVYKVLPINAHIIGNTIIPGIEGKKINIDKSYNKMKGTGLFNKELLVYDIIEPNISIKNNKNKFIVKGNSNKQMVSLIFILDDDKYFNTINDIANLKEVELNYFVSYSFLINNSIKIKETAGHEFYSYGDNEIYTPDSLLFSNNLISRIKGNEAIYCLSCNMDKDVLNLCSKNELYTIVPTIIGGESPYNSVKEKLCSGSIILLNMNNKTIIELSTIIDYIKGKGFKIRGLSKLLSE